MHNDIQIKSDIFGDMSCMADTSSSLFALNRNIVEKYKYKIKKTKPINVGTPNGTVTIREYIETSIHNPNLKILKNILLNFLSLIIFLQIYFITQNTRKT